MLDTLIPQCLAAYYIAGKAPSWRNHQRPRSEKYTPCTHNHARPRGIPPPSSSRACLRYHTIPYRAVDVDLAPTTLCSRRHPSSMFAARPAHSALAPTKPISSGHKIKEITSTTSAPFAAKVRYGVELEAVEKSLSWPARRTYDAMERKSTSRTLHPKYFAHTRVVTAR